MTKFVTTAAAVSAIAAVLTVGSVQAAERPYFTHTVAEQGCELRSAVSAVKGNHVGEVVRWSFWAPSGTIKTDRQAFTAPTQTLVSSAMYTTNQYLIDVHVERTRKDGTVSVVWKAASVGGTLDCP